MKHGNAPPRKLTTQFAAEVVLNGSIPIFLTQKSLETFEPVVLSLASRRKLYFRDLHGMTMAEILGPDLQKKFSIAERRELTDALKEINLHFE